MYEAIRSVAERPRHHALGPRQHAWSMVDKLVVAAGAVSSMTSAIGEMLNTGEMASIAGVGRFFTGSRAARRQTKGRGDFGGEGAAMIHGTVLALPRSL